MYTRKLNDNNRLYIHRAWHMHTRGGSTMVRWGSLAGSYSEHHHSSPWSEGSSSSSKTSELAN